MNNFAYLLKDFRVAEKSPGLPRVLDTPKPEKNKVVGEPTRVPVNKQSAMIIAPVRSWIYQPLPPEKLPNPHQAELDEARNQLRIERNAHARTKDMLGHLRMRMRDAQARIFNLERELCDLRKDAKVKDETIARLEDLKL